MQHLLIANWKMNPQRLSDALTLYKNISTAAKKAKKTSIVVASPVSFLAPLAALGKKKGPALAAQDLAAPQKGEHTGEESGAMLASVGASYVLVGHSERRALGESDELISHKILAAHKAKLIPVLCVGEHERDSAGEYLKEIERQLVAGLQYVTGAQLAKTIIAYEPVWAVGAGASGEASPRDVEEVNLYIRRVLADRIGPNKANRATILFGGSVNPANCAGYVRETGMNGLLVGRVSLTNNFKKIIDIVEEV